MKLGKTLSLFLITMMLTSCFGFIRLPQTAAADGLETNSIRPVVYVYPNYTTVGVGETFTIAVIGFNFTKNWLDESPLGNMTGFDIEFTWDPAILHYKSHTVTCPAENFPAPNLPSPYRGVLHTPPDPLQIMNVVNEAGNIPEASSPETRAWFAYAGFIGTIDDNGNFTFFTMTFEVVAIGASPIRILGCDLASGWPEYKPILAIVKDGLYRTVGVPMADFTYQPQIPVVDRPVNFTATVTGDIYNITNYMWDFADGHKENTTVPTVLHTFSTRNDSGWDVKLIVSDAIGTQSAAVRHFVPVTIRDLRVKEIKPLPPEILVLPGLENPIDMNTTIENYGPLRENFTLHTYYNTTNIDLADPLAATWTPIDSTDNNVTGATPGNIGTRTVHTRLNSSMLELKKYYYFLVNLTGIPTGSEKNVTDNHMVSPNAVFTTNETRHSFEIISYSCKYRVGTTNTRFDPPLLEGEKISVMLTIKNTGNAGDNATIRLYADGTETKQLEASLNANEAKAIAEWTETNALPVGNHNMTIVVQAGTFTANQTQWVRVVKTPLVQVTVSPSEIRANETVVTFSGNGTIHQDLGGNVTKWTWRFFAPEGNWDTGSPLFTLLGKTVNYTFTDAGNWTVVLEIEDNYGLKYESRRSSTNVYREAVAVDVKAPVVGGEGFPLMYILAIVLAVVAVVAVGVIVLIRRRRAGPTEIKQEPKET